MKFGAKGVTVLVSTHYMDEAIQCDFIAYIAYGKKLISGTARDIPKMIGLHTYRVTGPNLTALEATLRADPGVGQVARFGAVLHVSGTDEAALKALAAQNQAKGTHKWVLKEAELEEAFIYLMAGAADNYDGGPA